MYDSSKYYLGIFYHYDGLFYIIFVKRNNLKAMETGAHNTLWFVKVQVRVKK